MGVDRRSVPPPEFCDLDGFKTVNDTHGHATGDEVLAMVATRVSEQVREDDVVARLGGDEFVVLVENPTPGDTTAVTQLAQRISGALASPIVVGGTAVHLTVSIGIAVLDEHANDADSVLREADAAMYRAKVSGRNRHVFSDASELAEPTDHAIR